MIQTRLLDQSKILLLSAISVYRCGLSEIRSCDSSFAEENADLGEADTKL